MNLVVKAQIEEKNGRLIAVASSSVEDRHGEKVIVEGWDLKNFKANPVLLWGHDHNEPAIGNAKSIKITGKGSTAKLIFEPVFHDITEKARAIKLMFEKGIINSFSVGFRPLEAEGNQYLKQELLEISAVNVPANPEARMMASKALAKGGFDDATIKAVIDNQEAAFNDREELVERIKALESEVKVLRGQSSTSHAAEQRMRNLKAIDRLTEKLLIDTKKEIRNHESS
jgi:uncharacterized protein